MKKMILTSISVLTETLEESDESEGEAEGGESEDGESEDDEEDFSKEWGDLPDDPVKFGAGGGPQESYSHRPDGTGWGGCPKYYPRVSFHRNSESIRTLWPPMTRSLRIPAEEEEEGRPQEEEEIEINRF